MNWQHKKQPPFNDHLGIKIEEWQDGRVLISAIVQPEHLNSHGVPHGGFITTLIDVAGSYCGLYCPYPNRRRKSLTLSLTTNFTGRAKTNRLTAIGKLTNSGHNIFYSTTEVYDSQGTLIATGQMTMRYRSGSEILEGEAIEEKPEKSRL
ncbi:PaaI family thioesterase [Microbulbifer sp. OS29]|uniref:PaaI family thioesterase n=1 Tax=Microbulbifer okhotskensis TaxID=2926617 RepID=A0A9X2J7C5_9GAMM|nr:PaaI family thioesterase [Microbulbifer okhotskensis]MCO1335655.1 PaaI family thioesterase [Microbulbifer okhotskensis]